MKPERGTNPKRLLISGNILRIAGGEGSGRNGVAGGGHCGGYVLW